MRIGISPGIPQKRPGWVGVIPFLTPCLFASFLKGHDKVYRGHSNSFPVYLHPSPKETRRCTGIIPILIPCLSQPISPASYFVCPTFGEKQLRRPATAETESIEVLAPGDLDVQLLDVEDHHIKARAIFLHHDDFVFSLVFCELKCLDLLGCSLDRLHQANPSICPKGHGGPSYFSDTHTHTFGGG